MSGKFMTVKKFIIPTLTVVIMASQLMGCSAVSQKELLQMLDTGTTIEIEVAVPNTDGMHDGTEADANWNPLDLIKTSPALRAEIESLYGITPYGDESKNGIFYIDLEGNQCGNNTLYNVFANNTFRTKYWNDETMRLKLAELASNAYTDVEFDANDTDDAVLAAYLTYFDLMGVGGEENLGEANLDSTISRIDAMSAVFRAETPNTDDIPRNEAFLNSVYYKESDTNTLLASNMADYSYLDVASESMNEATANSTITRGEFAYMLATKYFAQDYKDADAKTECFSDAKNAGDLITKNKLQDKAQVRSAVLKYCIQNPDEGCPEEIYKALVVAKNKGIIVGDESRWDEGLTKKEMISMLTNAYMQLPTQLSAETGIGKDTEKVEAIQDEKLSEIDEAAGYETYNGAEEAEEIEAEQNIVEPDYVIEPMEGTKMFTQTDCRVRKGPSTDYENIDSFIRGFEVTVIGKVTNAEGKTWYVISSADEDKIETGVNDTNILEPNEDGTERMHHMISASLLADTKPAPVKPKTQSNNAGNSGSAATPSQPAAPSNPSCDCDCDCDCDNSGGFCDWGCDTSGTPNIGGIPVDNNW